MRTYLYNSWPLLSFWVNSYMAYKNLLANYFKELVRYASQNKRVQQFAAMNPKLYQAIIHRFDLKRFTGFPLTILAVLLLINVLTFSEIAENVIDSEAIVTIDLRFTRLLFSIREKTASQTFYLISYLGSQKGSIAIAAIVSVVLLRQRRRSYFIALWLVLLGVGLSVRYGKLIFHRVRPSNVAYYEETNFSFPSGHATTAMALFGLLCYFLLRNTHHKQDRYIYIAVTLLIILLVGFSRIYLGVHFLSDVLAGYLLGATWIILGITCLEWLSYQKNFNSGNL